MHADREAELISLAQAAAADHSSALAVSEIDAAVAKSKVDFESTEHGRTQRAVMDKLGTGGKLSLAIGVAGSGKSSLLAPLVGARPGRSIWGAALAWRQSEDLIGAGIAPDRCLAFSVFLERVKSGELSLDRDSIVIVDEVSLLGTKAFLDLLRLRSRYEFSIFAVGDPAQCQSIDSGPIIDLLRRALGPDAVPEILTSLRQYTERERATTLLFRDARATEALDLKRETYDAGRTSPAQLTSCPWCGSEISARRDVEVNTSVGRTTIYCSDSVGGCEFSKGKSSDKPHPGLPVSVVDEEIYHRPPSMMIATVDKFAMMAWRGETRTLFGRATTECPRHGLLWPDADCSGTHNARGALPRTTVKTIAPIRPPDLIIQDEFHLISGPLGTMVGLYETAIDELCSWSLGGKTVRPKVVASTATVRKATEQVNNVFMRRVAVFPPHGLDVADNFFSIQRSIETLPGRRYLGVCSPGSSRPAMLIRVYVAFLTAAQALFDRFGQAADPYMTTVGYFNSLRELGGMKRLCEDDVQTRSYRVEMSAVGRPGLAQRSVANVRELTSRVSSRDIPKYLDQLEVKFNATFDSAEDAYVTRWAEGQARAIDVVLATNMLSVGVDVNRLGLMVVNGQPKGTAEYIQATSRVGRSSPGLVCTVLTWARPRDLSHYETFEQYHGTFYKHVEAQSVTPFSPRAMDRGLTGTLLSVMRVDNATFNPNPGAGALDRPDRAEAAEARDLVVERAWAVSGEDGTRQLAAAELKSRLDEWSAEANVPGRTLAYEKKGPARATTVGLLKRPGLQPWDDFTVPMSMREVEPGVRLVMNTARFTGADPPWTPRPPDDDAGDDA